MGRDRYSLLRNVIDNQSNSFYLYLNTFFPHGIIRLLDELSKQTEFYIFSGVIKNFLLGFIEHRDLDLVIDPTCNLQIHLEKLRELGLAEIRRNKFNGVKLILEEMEVDIWRLEDTKGITDQLLAPTPENLIRTSFFNFSAIVYDYNCSRFIYDENFCDFLMKRELDVVYEENPFIESCIVSTFYYAEKYELSISFKLCNWIRRHYKEDMDFKKVQLRRFGREYYSNDVINKFCTTLLRYPSFKIIKITRIYKLIEIKFE